MRTSTEFAQTDQHDSLLMDEQLTSWHPDRISDRKLHELAARLEKVQRLGDAFADIALADPLQQRLRELQATPARNLR